jgi:hypothetical protein
MRLDASGSSSGSAAVIAAPVALVACGAVLLRRRRLRVRAQLWRDEGACVLEEATTTAALLVAAGQQRTAFAPVSVAVTRVGSNLDRLAAQAPATEAREAARALAARLRTVCLDVEAAVLVRRAVSDAADRAPSRGPFDPELVVDLDDFRRHVEAAVHRRTSSR